MAFDSGTTNPGSGGLTLAVNTFTDTDAIARTAPFSQLAFGLMDAVPTIVSTSNGLPVAQQGTWNVGTVTTVTTVGAVTAITNALPAGTNVIGHVITDTGSTTAVTGTVAVTQSGSWTVAVTGVATAANQATEIASLASIDGKITAVNTGAVVVSSSALPSGAATAAKQPALGTAGTASADVITVQGRTGMTAIVVDGSAVTQPVSGTVAVSGLSGTVAATQSGTWTVQPGNTANTTAWLVTGTGGSFPVTDSGGSLTIDNSTLAVVGAGTEAAAMRVTIATDSTGVLSIDDNGGSITVDGTVAVSGSVAVTGTFWQATQPISAASLPSHDVTNAGTFSVQASSVIPGTGATNLGKAIDTATGATDTGVLSLATRDDALSVLTPVEGDNVQLRTDANGALWVIPSGTVTVSGTVTANIGTAGTLSTAANQTTIIGHLDGVEGLLGTIDADTGNISTKIDTLAGAVSGTEMQVDVLTMPTVTVNAHAVTNAGTFVVQENGAALTALQLLDDTVTTLGTDTYTEATSKGIAIGAVRRDADTTLVDTTNEFGPLQMDANGRLKVEVFSGETLPVSLTSTTVTGTVAVTQSGTWDEVGINDSGNSITVDNGGTFAVQAAGDTAHDAVDANSPQKIGAKATASVLGETPVAAADRTNLFAGTDGVLLQRPHSSLEDIISETKTNTDGASTAMTSAFAATASQRIYLTTLILSNSSATGITVDIRDGSAGSVLITVPVPATGGAVINFPIPLRFSANTAAAFDASAATTTLSCSMVGFKSKT